MAEHVIETQIIATGVSFEEYVEKYAIDSCEYVGGTVIQMNPVSLPHAKLVSYLNTLFETYFEQMPIGEVVMELVMRLPNIDRGREPDLLIVLNENAQRLGRTYVDGPADICIEVVSPESVARDHGDKLLEYEKGGVGEYWILDQVHSDALFYRMGSDGRFVRHSEHADGTYRTPLLPKFWLHVPTLWQEQLPRPSMIAKAVKQMLS